MMWPPTAFLGSTTKQAPPLGSLITYSGAGSGECSLGGNVKGQCILASSATKQAPPLGSLIT